VDAAAIEATADGITFVAPDAEIERQVARGDRAAKGVGTFGPVGEAAQFVAQAVIHRAKYNIRICDERKRRYWGTFVLRGDGTSLENE